MFQVYWILKLVLMFYLERVGIQLGAVWEELTTSVQLAGNLAPVEAKGLILTAQIASFAPVRLVFAWSLTDDVPLLLGRMNFFL